MKTLSRRLLSLLLAMSMALSLLGVSVWAAEAEQDTAAPESAETSAPEETGPEAASAQLKVQEEEDVDDQHWSLSGSTLTITGTGVIEAYPDWADDASVSTLTIGDGITGIGDTVFYDYSSLTTVNFPSSLTSIGDSAFQGCTSLSRIDLSNVTSIRESAFAGSGVTYVDLSNVSYIGASAFSDCTSLTQAGLPGISKISENLFSGCTSLQSVYLPYSVTEIGAGAYAGCTSLTSIDLSHVTAIGDSAFAGSGLTKVTLQNCSVGGGAFEGCSELLGAYIKGAISSWGDSVFADCTSLTSINGLGFWNTSTVPESMCSGCTSLTDKGLKNILQYVTGIEDEAFNGCTGLENPEIPANVTFIGEAAFVNCTGLKTVTIPKTVTNIWDDNFFEEGSDDLVKTNVTIKGARKSAAEEYAKKNGFTFKATDGKVKNVISLEDGSTTIIHKVSPKDVGKIVEIDGIIELKLTDPEAKLSFKSNSSDLFVNQAHYGIKKKVVANKTYSFSVTVTAEETEKCKKSEQKITIKLTSGDVLKDNVITVNSQFNNTQILKVDPDKERIFDLGAKSLEGELYFEAMPNGIDDPDWYNPADTEIGVDQSGKVYVPAAYVGKAKIIITSEDTEQYKHNSKTVEFTVEKFDNSIDVQTDQAITGSQTESKTVTLSPKSDNPESKFSYSASPAAVSVSGDGTVTIPAKFEGYATITINDAGSTFYKKASRKSRIFVLEANITEEKLEEICQPGSNLFSEVGTNDSIAEPTIADVKYTTDGVKVDFTPVKNADGYYVYENGQFVIVLDENGTPYLQKLKELTNAGSDLNTQSVEAGLSTQSETDTITFLDTNAKDKNKVYKYQIVAFNAEGAGKMSEVKTSETPAPAVTKPSTPSKLTVKAKKQTATVSWKRNKKATGYEVQYTTDKKFKKSVKKVTIKKNKTVSTTVKKLTKKKTWYFRIRAYKTVSGKKYYSKWSGAKSVKIK